MNTVRLPLHNSTATRWLAGLLVALLLAVSVAHAAHDAAATPDHVADEVCAWCQTGGHSPALAHQPPQALVAATVLLPEARPTVVPVQHRVWREPARGPPAVSLA